MLLEALLGFIGFIAIIAFVILAVVFMAYRAQAPNKGYVSELEQVAWIAFGFLSGAAVVGLLFGWNVLAISLTVLLLFCSSIVLFGLT